MNHVLSHFFSPKSFSCALSCTIYWFRFCSYSYFFILMASSTPWTTLSFLNFLTLSSIRISFLLLAASILALSICSYYITFEKAFFYYVEKWESKLWRTELIVWFYWIPLSSLIFYFSHANLSLIIDVPLFYTYKFSCKFFCCCSIEEIWEP